MTEGRDAGVGVTQADREIAAAILEGPPWRHDRIAAIVRAGKDDDHQLVRCAVTSRLAAEAAAQARVAQLEAALRKIEACDQRTEYSTVLNYAEDRISSPPHKVAGTCAHIARAALRQTDTTAGDA